jgi:hypothetical protein
MFPKCFNSTLEKAPPSSHFMKFILIECNKVGELGSSNLDDNNDGNYSNPEKKNHKN